MPDINIKIVIDGKEALGTLNLTDEQLKKIAQDAGTAGKSATSSFADIGSIVTGLNQGLELARKGFEIVSQPLEKAGQFEQYETSLKVMLGSTEAAQARLAELVEFAKTTPFELPQVVQAANQLQAIGAYSQDNLRMLGDLAAASGKPMEQALAAYSKMMTGQKGMAIDMFRDLLISADDWAKATGKKIGKNGELQASVQEMAEALPKILKKKGFDGMMQAQSETFNGMVSNVSDAFGQLETAIGERLLGPGKQVASVLSSVATALTPVKTNLEQAQEASFNQRVEFETMVGTYTRLRDEANKTEGQTKLYKETIEKLKTTYPDHLKNLDLEKGSYEKIRDAIKATRDELIEKAKTDAIVATQKDYLKTIADEEASIAKATVNIEKLKAELEQGVKSYTDQALTGNAQAQVYKIGGYEQDIKESKEKIQKATQDLQVLGSKYKDILDKALRGDPDNTGGLKGGSSQSSDKSAFEKDKEKELETIEKTNDKVIATQKAHNLDYLGLQEELNNELQFLASIEEAIADAKDDKVLNSLKLEKEISEQRIKVYQDEAKKKEEVESKDLEEWRKKQDEKLKSHEEYLKQEKDLADEDLKLIVDAINNEEERKLRELDIWYNQELAKFAGHAEAKLLIDKVYSQKRHDILKETFEQTHPMIAQEMNVLVSGFRQGWQQLTQVNRQAKDGWDAVWLAMENTALQSIGNILEKYIENLIMEQVIGDSFKAAEITSATATGSAIASAYAPAAAFASIASFGGADLAGSAGLAATTALAYSLAIPKFGEGAIDIPGRDHSHGGKIIEIEGGESVINKQATKKYLPYLEAINSGKGLPIVPSTAGVLTSIYNIKLAADTSRAANMNPDSGSTKMLESLRDDMKKYQRAIEKLADRPLQISKQLAHKIYYEGNAHHRESSLR